jgi:hypothetical protein
MSIWYKNSIAETFSSTEAQFNDVIHKLRQ